MPTNCCPKTCNQLCVAAILISVGIVQVIAGIILIKSEDIYLLAGTDFVVATSNVLVGSLLGIAASVWEKKKKVVSLKNTTRQNVLAGLHIAVLSMNCTGAIIMILGDGSKLLIAENNIKESEDILREVLACAYVTSVCSPIVCLVISLVCLSGNRIQIYENMKKKNSLARKESYGWVFENNHDSQTKNQGSSSTQIPSVSDDVFEKKSVVEKLFKAKPSKKNKASNSSTSVSELKSPLEIWTHKRNKIIEEITSPKPMFFSDDYLQFPEYKCDAYIGALIPRITQNSLIRTNSRDIAQTTNSENLGQKMVNDDKKMCKPSKPHLDELNLKLENRRMSHPDLARFNGQIDCIASLKPSIKDERKSIDETDAQTSYSTHSSLYRTLANSVGVAEIQPKTEKHFDFEPIDSPRERLDVNDNQISPDWLQDPYYNIRRNSNDSGSSGLTAETISELKAKINKMNCDENEIQDQKAEFFRSFKHDTKHKSHLSESDIEDKRSVFQKMHDQYGEFSQNSESDSKTPLAGEVVPISIRSTTIDRTNSIPLKTICPQAPSRYSLQSKIPDQNLNPDLDNTQLILTSGESQSNQRSGSFTSSFKDKSTDQSRIESNSASIKNSEKKFDFKHRMSVMGSIAESPTEEFLQIAQLPKSVKREHELTNSSQENSERDSAKNVLRHKRNTYSSRRMSLKAAPSLLNRLWSVKRAETKADITSLIMDSDSLVGLSDDDLMARTRRLRQLRKTVELRSKNEKHDVV